MGFLLFACGVGNLSLFAVLALGGLLAGCLKDVGRLFAGLAFWMTAVLFSFYGEPVFANKEQLLWLGVGALLFLFLPKEIGRGWGTLAGKSGKRPLYPDAGNGGGTSEGVRKGFSWSGKGLWRRRRIGDRRFPHWWIQWRTKSAKAAAWRTIAGMRRYIVLTA